MPVEDEPPPEVCEADGVELPEPDVDPEDEPDADPEDEPDADPEGEPDADPEVEPDADPEVEPEAEPDSDEVWLVCCNEVTVAVSWTEETSLVRAPLESVEPTVDVASLDGRVVRTEELPAGLPVLELSGTEAFGNTVRGR